MTVNVKFFTDIEELQYSAPPVPAHKFWPEWFKQQKPIIPHAQDDSPTSATIRKCPAALDILSMGYIIPLWCDIKLKQNSQQLAWMMPDSARKFFAGIQTHSEMQMDSYPFKENTFKGSVKFMNPWSIITPPGYSCMLTNPVYHINENISAMTGVIETDRYHEAHVNTFFTSEDDEEILLRKGMPLVQVIPFKREEYQMETAFGDHRSIENKSREFDSDCRFDGDKDRYRKDLYIKRYN